MKTHTCTRRPCKLYTVYIHPINKLLATFDQKSIMMSKTDTKENYNMLRFLAFKFCESKQDYVQGDTF